MSYTDTHAARLRDMKSLAQKIQSKAGLYDKAWTHNSKPRGNLLGTSITDAQHSAIANGSFKDIYPGDHWKFDNYCLIVVDCNMFGGYSILTGINMPNHVVCIALPKTPTDYKMTDDNSIAGGLASTYVYTNVLPTMTTEIEALVGADNLIAMPKLMVSSAIDTSTGVVTKWTETDTNKLMLPTYGQLYGGSTGHELYRYMNSRFALFNFINAHQAMWIPMYSNYNQMWLAELGHYVDTDNAQWIWGYGAAGGSQMVGGWCTAGTASSHSVVPYLLLK